MLLYIGMLLLSIVIGGVIVIGLKDTLGPIRRRLYQNKTINYNKGFKFKPFSHNKRLA